MTILGTANFRYKPLSTWPSMPRYWSFETAVAVAVNAQDEVHVLSLGKHPLTIWDTDGDFISSWGEGAFSDNPHGIHIGPTGNIWIVDRDYHIATEHTPAGEIIRVLGTKLSASPTIFGEPFNMPSGLETTPTGEIFVSDGYGGNRVHRFAADGTLLRSWGEAGVGPGKFALLHNVAIDTRGRVFICDRMNHRIQLFDYEGNYLEEWTGFSQPCEVCIRDDVIYVIEQGDGSAVSIWTMDHELITTWRGNHGIGNGTLTAGHGISVDSEGSIYVADVRSDHHVLKFQRL